MWENHPCCVVVVRDELINTHKDAVQEFTNLLVQAGEFIFKRPEAAAEIGVSFLDPTKTLGLSVPVLKNVLKESKGIRTNDLFPVVEDFVRMQEYMSKEMGVGSPIDIRKFVDTRFAEIACRGMASGRKSSNFRKLSDITKDILERQEAGGSTKNMLSKEGKYLFFSLAGQEYGIGIASVKEVIRMMPARSLPQTPPFIKGVINLRGKVIPLIDLCDRFGLHHLEYGDRSCIIILEISNWSGVFHVGIAVESVSEVVSIKAVDVDETMGLGGGHMNYILGMAKIAGSVKILLNAANLFASEETEQLQAV